MHQSGTDKETKVTITITITRVGYISADLPNRSQRSLIRVQYRGIYSTIRVRAHGHKQKRRPKVTSQRFLPGYLLEQSLEKKCKPERQIHVVSHNLVPNATHAPVRHHVMHRVLAIVLFCCHTGQEAYLGGTVLLNALLVRGRSSGRCGAGRRGRAATARLVDVDVVEQPVRIGKGLWVVGDVLLARVGQSAAGAVGAPDGVFSSPVAAEGGVL